MSLRSLIGLGVSAGTALGIVAGVIIAVAVSLSSTAASSPAKAEFSPTDVSETGRWATATLAPLHKVLRDKKLAGNQIAFQQQLKAARSEAAEACWRAEGQKISWTVIVSEIKQPAGVHLSGWYAGGDLQIARSAEISAYRDWFYVRAGEEIPWETVRKLRPGDSILVEGVLEELSLEERSWQRYCIRARVRINSVVPQKIAAVIQ